MKDPYTYEDSDVLINKFNIKDKCRLATIESSLYREATSKELPTGSFDFDHLKSIHKAFFGDLYPFAGEVRTVNLAKNDTMFCNNTMIESSAKHLFSQLKNENFLHNHQTKEQKVDRLAHYFAEINAIHPFREGNGRTNREFISQLAEHNNLKLDFTQVNREEYLQASIYSWHGDNTPLENVLSKCLSNLNNDNAPQPIQLVSCEDVLNYFSKIDSKAVDTARKDGWVTYRQPGYMPTYTPINKKPLELAQALSKVTNHEIPTSILKELEPQHINELSLTR